MKKFLIMAVVSIFFCCGVALAVTNCPPDSLPANPKPVIAGGGSKCIVEASWVELELEKSWTRKVELKSGQGYWFSASKCARGKELEAEIRDSKNIVVKSAKGSSIGICFVPKTAGSYTISYKVTRLNGSYAFAVTSACFAESNCK